MQKKTILVVDDTPENIDVLAGVLTKTYKVLAAKNGEKALEILAITPPDLILLDIMMPVMDGYETCQRIKSNPYTCDIPIIFLTAKSQTEDIVKGFELGAVDYLTKPFEPSELLVRVRTHLELCNARKVIETQKITLEKQNSELIEAAKLREDIEQITRHDLKTPLNAIIGYPQLLLDRESLSDKGQRYLDIIRQSGYRMLNMINLSLDLFKMERGDYQLEVVPVNVLQILEKIKGELGEIMEHRKLELVVNCIFNDTSKEGVFLVKGEELLCYSMFANLLKNAMEASPEEGEVQVTLQRLGSAIVQIHNQGAVPVAIRERFFEKFTTAEKSSGTGLGTYSAKLIAETLKGKIAMQTSDSEGTTLTVELPLIDSPAMV